jgi:hypothetical protein
MLDFRNLDVWHRATNLNKTIDEMTADFPESQAFGLRCQMRRASASICSDIVEGCGRWRRLGGPAFLDVTTAGPLSSSAGRSSICSES